MFYQNFFSFTFHAEAFHCAIHLPIQDKLIYHKTDGIDILNTKKGLAHLPTLKLFPVKL